PNRHTRPRAPTLEQRDDPVLRDTGLDFEAETLQILRDERRCLLLTIRELGILMDAMPDFRDRRRHFRGFLLDSRKQILCGHSDRPRQDPAHHGGDNNKTSPSGHSRLLHYFVSSQITRASAFTRFVRVVRCSSVVVSLSPVYFAGVFHVFTTSSIVLPAFLASCTNFTKSPMNSEYSLRSAVVIVVGLWPLMIVSTFFALAALASVPAQLTA